MEKMLIVEGEMIHHVGYRPFLLTEALKRKKITNFEAENFKQNGKQKVIINMVGEEQKILEFVEFIKNNFPDYAKNCKVIEEKDSCPSEVMHINDFRDILSVEQQNNMVQGGLQVSNKIDNLGIGLGNKIDNLGIGIDGLGNKIDNLGIGIDGLGNKIDNLGIGIDGIGNKIDNLGIGIDGIGNKIDILRNETNNNFKEMNEKYKLISEGMFAVVSELKDTNKKLGERIEKTDKNIEELLKILIEKK